LLAATLGVARTAHAEPTPADTEPTPLVDAEPPVADSASPPPEHDSIEWRPEWKRFQPVEYAITGAMIAGTAAFILFGKDGEPNWRGPILFDKAVHDELRATTSDGRRAAQTVGDAFYYGGLAYPFVVDALAVTLVGHGKSDVAGQMALIDTEAFAITGFLSFLSNATIRRERPYVRQCGAGRENPHFPDCETPGQAEGFFSGHTAIAYTGAALTCSHHAHLPLYGKSGVGGTITCATMLAGATVGGIARVYADKHYLSDVVVGAAIGLTSGLVVPWLHYRGGNRTEGAAAATPTSDLHVFPVPVLSLDGGGLGAAGIF
jgi:membrane-associated phospholipid phosphatase